MDGLRDVGALIGRILLAVIFLLSGVHKLMSPSATIHLIGGQGVPLSTFAYAVTVAIEFGGAVLIILGLASRPAAFIMFLWLIPVTILFHVIPHYQAMHQGQAMAAMQQQINYMKNISIMGGLLMVAAMGPGAFSLGGRRTSIETGPFRRAA
jgi:putative oxidoreductase